MGFRRLGSFCAALLVIVLAAACTAAVPGNPDAGTRIGPEGGTVDAPAGAGQLRVPRGTVSTPVQVWVSVASDPPRDAFDGRAFPIGKTIEVDHTGPIDGAQVRLPVDPALFDRAAPNRAAADQQDAFVAVFNDHLNMWIPLPTTLDAANSVLVANPPHLSKVSAFVTRAGELARRAGHDIKAGLAVAWESIGDSVDGWFNGESKKPDCATTAADWKVQADEPNVNGCVVDRDGHLATRIGNDVRIPYDVALPRGYDVGFGEYDLDVSLPSLLLKAMNRPLNTMVLPARGRGEFDLPNPAPARTSLRMMPDQLGLALDVVLGMLNWIPGTKVFREVVTERVAAEVWSLGAQGLSRTQIVIETQKVLEKELKTPDVIESAKLWSDASSCIVAAFDAGQVPVSTSDPVKWAEAAESVARECLASVLKQAGSAFEDAWGVISSIPTSFRVIGQIGDAIRVGFEHFGGQLNLDIRHELPDPITSTDWVALGAREVPDCQSSGFGVELRFPVVYGDVTGDGLPEAFVPFECSTGDSSDYPRVEVFDGASSASSPRKLSELSNGVAPANPFGITLIRVNAVQVSGPEATFSGNGYTPTDCIHCPSFTFTQTFTWNGNAFTTGKFSASPIPQ